MQMLAPSPCEYTRTFPTRARMPACGGSLRRLDIQDAFTLLADLNYFPFLFERG